MAAQQARRRDARPRGGVARALALGVLHGPAELLPVSSSAHVVLARRALGWDDGDPEYRKAEEVALHLGTALALARRPTAFAVAAAVPPALVGAAFERCIEQRLSSPRALATGLVAGGVALALADCRESGSYARFGDTHVAMAVGAGQAAALWPGVSRYGAALAAGRACGLDRETADARAREAAGPVLLGASALKALRLGRRAERPPLAPLALAAGASWASTALAARAGIRPRGPLWTYAAYRIALAAAVGSGR